MALIKCTECGAEISDKAASCPKCGNPMIQAAMSPELVSEIPALVQKNGGAMTKFSTWAIWMVNIIVILAIAGMISYANRSPEERARYDRKQASDTICDQMISDSAPGNERRDIRRMCDELKAQNK